MVLAPFGRRACVVAVLSLIPASVLAQGASTATIAGVVRDPSGGVLPGVTVEAASPALIEKVRSTVTDDRGEYRLPELRPGYTPSRSRSPASPRSSATASSCGPTSPLKWTPNSRSASSRRPLPSSGATPLVDVQSATQQRTVSRELLDTVPDRQERARHRGADPRGRRAPERAGRRRQQGRTVRPHHRARRQDIRLASAAGRHALQRVDARHRQPRRHGPRLLRQSAGRAGGRCRPRDDGLGRVLARRRAGEQHSQGRRQPVQRDRSSSPAPAMPCRATTSTTT